MKQPLLNNECIICIETDNCVLVKKNAHCVCEYSVHKKCLNKWIQKQNKCIICRKSYDTENDDITLVQCCRLIILNLCLYTLCYAFLYALLFFLTFGTMFGMFYICVKLI
jgi:hypothetical protein